MIFIDRPLKEKANFEKTASSEKEQLYEDSIRNVTKDKILPNFWQKSMNGKKAQEQIPDVMREDGIIKQRDQH